MWGARGLGMGEGLAGCAPHCPGPLAWAAQPLQPRLHISSPTHCLFIPTSPLSWVRSRAESHLSEPPFPFSVLQLVELGNLRGLQGLLGLFVVVCPIWMFPLGPWEQSRHPLVLYQQRVEEESHGW